MILMDIQIIKIDDITMFVDKDSEYSVHIFHLAIIEQHQFNGLFHIMFIFDHFFILKIN